MYKTQISLDSLFQYFDDVMACLPEQSDYVQAIPPFIQGIRTIEALTDEEKPPREDITQLADYGFQIFRHVVPEVNPNQDHKIILKIRDLHLPFALWVIRQNGEINDIEGIVNNIAAFANELTNLEELKLLSSDTLKVLLAISDVAKQGYEAEGMQPWTLMNLNYGIVATRTLDPSTIENAFDYLANNVPDIAQRFFSEGKNKMSSSGYPQEVQDIMEHYFNEYVADTTFH